MKRFFLLALVCACGAKKSAGPTCDDLRPMVDRMYAATMKELGPGMKPDERKRAADVAVQVTPAMKEAIVEACRADRWPAEAVTCMTAVSSGRALDDCEAKLPAEARAHVEAAMSEVVTRIQPPDEPAQDDDDQLGIGESGLPECDAYATAMQAYLDCDEIAAPVKASARAGLDDLRRTWPALRDPATGASAKQAAAAACVAARDELDKSAEAMGCGARDAGAAPDCAVLGPMIRAILAEQLRDVPADKRDAAEAQSRALAAPLEQSLVETCTAGRWSASAVACFDRARTGASLVACEAQLTPEQADRLGHAMEDVTAKIARGSAGGAPVPAPLRLAECDDYLAAANALLACDKLASAQRAELQRSMALVVDGLKRLSDPTLPAALDVARTCTKARESTKALAVQLGCAPS